MPHSNNILRISYNTIPDKPKSNIDKAIETKQPQTDFYSK